MALSLPTSSAHILERVVTVEGQDALPVTQPKMAKEPIVKARISCMSQNVWFVTPHQMRTSLPKDWTWGAGKVYTSGNLAVACVKEVLSTTGMRNADAFSNKSHMIKHWVMSHPEVDGRPAFKFTIKTQYKDCLSRQVGDGRPLRFYTLKMTYSTASPST